MYCVLDPVIVPAELEVFSATQSFEMDVLHVNLWEFLITQRNDCSLLLI